MLTKRLQHIVSCLPTVNTLLDVGCDHGYVGNYALNNNLAHKVIFVDVSKASLQKAKRLCNNDRATFVCQDGIGNLSGDCAVIAGMGGLEIIDILTNAKQKVNTLVLQPMRNQKDLRLYLVNNGYNLNKDYKFCDGKYYDIIVATASNAKQNLTDLQLEFGMDNLASPTTDFACYLQRQLQTYQSILQQCNDSGVQEYLQLLTLALATIKEKQS